MSLWCHLQALQLMKTVSYCGAKNESMCLTPWAALLSLEAFDTCIHQLTPSYSSISSPQHHQTASPTYRCPTEFSVIWSTNHILFFLSLRVLQNVEECFGTRIMDNVNFLPGLETIVTVCSHREQLQNCLWDSFCHIVCQPKLWASCRSYVEETVAEHFKSMVLKYDSNSCFYHVHSQVPICVNRICCFESPILSIVLILV